MALYANLIPELEAGDPPRVQRQGRCATMAERIAELFVDASDRFDAAQIALFDEILGRLIEEIEHQTLTEISRRIAPGEHAPIGVVRRLAGDDNINVAGPMLRASPRLAEAALAAIASRMGSPHLLAISQRANIATPVTDILVARGDTSVRHIASGRRQSRRAIFRFSIRNALVKRAGRRRQAGRNDRPACQDIRASAPAPASCARRPKSCDAGCSPRPTPASAETKWSAALAEVAAEPSARRSRTPISTPRRPSWQW